MLPFLLAPFSRIYYPLETLPVWMQNIAQYLSTICFRGHACPYSWGEWLPDFWAKLSCLTECICNGAKCFLYFPALGEETGSALAIWRINGRFFGRFDKSWNFLRFRSNEPHG